MAWPQAWAIGVVSDSMAGGSQSQTVALLLPLSARFQPVTLPGIEARSADGSFGPQDVVAELRRRGSTRAKFTIRTHVVSRMYANGPDHHARTYDDVERVSDGRYRRR